MFLRNGPKLLNVLVSSVRGLTTSSMIESITHPELYNGVPTKYGWVLVRRTHVARGWTQASLNEKLDSKFGNAQQSLDRESIQEVVDDWVESVDIFQKPKTRKRSRADVNSDNDMRLYLQQSKFEDGTGTAEKRTSETEVKSHKKIDSGAVTYTNAWNYYMTVTYPKFKHLPHKEARQTVGVQWRQLSLDEKEAYRQEYSSLLKQGKDILNGKIVDSDVKLQASQKLWEAKERTRLRKLGVLPPTNRTSKQ
ncbi:hypothetical protein OY671_000270 [Metschnikowia pulcherrima]|nr:hypothetical protein OY671_000270 [Metschnikowia pulcherrima]